MQRIQAEAHVHPPALPERFHVHCMQRSGAGPGVDLALEAVDAKGRQREPLAPPDYPANGGPAGRQGEVIGVTGHCRPGGRPPDGRS
jgi:hypothetical protein